MLWTVKRLELQRTGPGGNQTAKETQMAGRVCAQELTWEGEGERSHEISLIKRLDSGRLSGPSCLLPCRLAVDWDNTLLSAKPLVL
jgi:hypothetical protein